MLIVHRYEQIVTLNTNGTNWANPGNNGLPLVDWTTISGSDALSGTFKPYDSSDSTVIADDLSALAAAKIDFILLDVTFSSAADIAKGEQ